MRVKSQQKFNKIIFNERKLIYEKLPYYLKPRHINFPRFNKLKMIIRCISTLSFPHSATMALYELTQTIPARSIRRSIKQTNKTVRTDPQYTH
jgi:hypothetical protein